MKLKADLSKKYGLVLEGGGAKGAYQIGAWKALRENGIQICAVAGTSVGALNGALICMDDVAKAEHLWETISYSKVMDVDDDLMESVYQGKLSPKEALIKGIRLFADGGADITPLKELIAKNIDEDSIRSGNVRFYVLTFSITDRKELDLDLQQINKGELPEILLASAYLPVFKNQKLNGKMYMDGGMFNNVPLESLVKRNYKNIIMLRIYGLGREKKVEVPEDVTVHSIAPRVNLGRMLDFDSKKSKRNILVGYYDAMRWLYGLSGTIYYLDEEESEESCLERLLTIKKAVKESALMLYKIPVKNQSVERAYLEHLLPLIAAELKLGKDWTYKSLYISMAEAAAKQLKVQKYRIYTIQELLDIIHEKLQVHAPEQGLPAFVYIIADKVET